MVGSHTWLHCCRVNYLAEIYGPVCKRLFIFQVDMIDSYYAILGFYSNYISVKGQWFHTNNLTYTSSSIGC